VTPVREWPPITEPELLERLALDDEQFLAQFRELLSASQVAWRRGACADRGCHRAGGRLVRKAGCACERNVCRLGRFYFCSCITGVTQAAVVLQPRRSSRPTGASSYPGIQGIPRNPTEALPWPRRGIRKAGLSCARYCRSRLLEELEPLPEGRPARR
jgi:hypothetical protein